MTVFKKVLMSIAIVCGMFGLSLFATAPSYAATDICHQSGVPQEVKDANGCSHSSTNQLRNVIIGIVNGVVGISGLVAAIFVVVGGVNYMTSAGDAGKLQKAKSTILYALIGLAIAALTFTIVNFVLVNVIG